MSSLYLGKIGGADGTYEIHALTKDLSFRELPASEIADRSLFNEILSARYALLAKGNPIYCTAIHPDHEKRVEINPHDDREGTVHIVSLNDKGRIECALSVAVDLGARDRGDIVGLPLENVWQRNGYPEGARLDSFRKRYLRLHYERDRDLKQWEMAELYRHFRAVGANGDMTARIGLYTGLSQLVVKEAIKKGATPTWLWVFDAIPSYFNLYRWVGAAILRDFAVKDTPRCISPNMRQLKEKVIDGQEIITFMDETVSRLVKTPIPYLENGEVRFRMTDVPFLDGIVDHYKLDVDAICKSPTLLNTIDHEGFDWIDKIKLRIGLTITAKSSYEMFQPKHTFNNFINKLILKRYCPAGWEFNRIGNLRGVEPKDYDYKI